MASKPRMPGGVRLTYHGRWWTILQVVWCCDVFRTTRMLIKSRKSNYIGCIGIANLTPSCPDRLDAYRSHGAASSNASRQVVHGQTVGASKIPSAIVVSQLATWCWLMRQSAARCHVGHRNSNCGHPAPNTGWAGSGMAGWISASG